MNICLVGVNHRTAPVAIREKAAIRSANLQDSLAMVCELFRLDAGK